MSSKKDPVDKPLRFLVINPKVGLSYLRIDGGFFRWDADKNTATVFTLGGLIDAVAEAASRRPSNWNHLEQRNWMFVEVKEIETIKYEQTGRRL